MLYQQDPLLGHIILLLFYKSEAKNQMNHFQAEETLPPFWQQ